MKFILHPYNEEVGWSNYRISEGGVVHLGVYRVMYGFRVRAGRVADRWGCTLDWCGGANWQDVERLYSLCLGILSQRDEANFSFERIPTVSKVKPFYLDEYFVKTVSDLAGGFELITLEKSSLEISDVSWR